MAPASNHLIERLPHKERLCLLALGELVPLVLSEVLGQPDQPARFVYFPTDGFISLVALANGHQALEVGMVGREGMLGAQLVLGVAMVPWHALVQGSGHAWRIGADAFCRELAGSAPLRVCLGRYLAVLMAQRTAAAACQRFHTIGPRLARWLLMGQDRAQASSFHVTHEMLAYLLGVRRVGITTAAGALQRKGLIAYHRGHLSVLDRDELQAVACSCYAADRRVYADLLPEAGPLRCCPHALS